MGERVGVWEGVHANVLSHIRQSMSHIRQAISHIRQSRPDEYVAGGSVGGSARECAPRAAPSAPNLQISFVD